MSELPEILEDIQDDGASKCDSCDKEFDFKKEGSSGVDNDLCGSCLKEANDIENDLDWIGVLHDEY